MEIGGAVVGMAGGSDHSLVTTAEGRVLAFGVTEKSKMKILTEKNCTNQSLLWTVGWGSGRGWMEALTPTAIDGITIGDGEEVTEGKE